MHRLPTALGWAKLFSNEEQRFSPGHRVEKQSAKKSEFFNNRIHPFCFPGKQGGESTCLGMQLQHEQAKVQSLTRC